MRVVTRAGDERWVGTQYWGPEAWDLRPDRSTATKSLTFPWEISSLVLSALKEVHEWTGLHVQAMTTHTRSATAVDRKGLSGPALRTFFRIAELWRLTVEEQMTLLGVTARSTFFKWTKDPNVVLQEDTLKRISCIVGVYEALQILLPDEEAADEWVRRPNAAPMFSGRSALDRMLSGHVADLFFVRQYLDAQLGGWKSESRA